VFSGQVQGLIRAFAKGRPDYPNKNSGNFKTLFQAHHKKAILIFSNQNSLRWDK
jgi:hypothetical protein